MKSSKISTLSVVDVQCCGGQNKVENRIIWWKYKYIPRNKKSEDKEWHWNESFSDQTIIETSLNFKS